MKKILATTLTLVVLLGAFAGCSSTDVVLKYSPDSFNQIAESYPEILTDNTLIDHYYYLTVDGDTTLKISHDYELTGADDIMIETPLNPFLAAGLSAEKLGSGYKIADDMLLITADYENGTGMKDTVADALFESVSYDRSLLSYHQELDHYGIGLTAGKFEWAKDYSANDKDIVFVLKAQPLKDIGVEVTNIEGWIFATVKDADGTDVDVLLKPYNLDNN